MRNIVEKSYNAYEAIRIRFEDEDDKRDLLPEERRVVQLNAIYEYAIRNGFDEAAKHALSAKCTTEKSEDILLEIGLYFDGIRLHTIEIDDKIDSVPKTRSKVINKNYVKRRF